MKINEVVLTELFDNVRDWKWVDQDYDFWKAKFQTENGTQYITVIMYDEFKGDGFWEIIFRTTSGDTGQRTDEYESNQVLATVVDITKNFVEQNDPERILISGTDTDINRNSTYEKMIDKMLPKIYTVKKEKNSFTISKKRSTE